jgi:hypothetical protein
MVEQTAMGYQTNKIDNLENRKSPSVGDNKKRLPLGPDFILSHSVSGTARLSSGQPRSPGFTSRSDIIIAQCSRLQQSNNKNQSCSPWALISILPAAFQQQLGHSPSDRGHQAITPVLLGVTIPLELIVAETSNKRHFND